jgi:DNA repair protein RecO (recombination protein O)
VSRPRVYRTEGVILRQQRLGEADRILTVYTPQFGKLRVVGKGVRKTKSRIGGHLEPLTRVDLLLAQGKSLDIVSQGQTVDPYLALRDDLWRVTCALYLAELVDRFTEEAAHHVENRSVYGLLIGALHWLTLARSGDLVMRHFELQILELAGYRPQLFRCARCDAELGPDDRTFRAVDGGLLCQRCAPGDLGSLSLPAVKVLRFLAGASMTEADRLGLDAVVQAELERTLTDYVRFVLEREVNSRRFVDEVRVQEARLSAGSGGDA